jgi:hypothetical protein
MAVLGLRLAVNWIEVTCPNIGLWRTALGNFSK